MKNNFPDSLTIQRYLDGTLEPEMMHQLERQALEDPFLADALEGYSLYGNSVEDLSIMQRQLHQRIVHLQENKKVFDLTWQRLSVATTAAVMFITAGLLFWMTTHRSPEGRTSDSQKRIDVHLVSPDSARLLVKGSGGQTDESYIVKSEQVEASEILTAALGNETSAKPASGWPAYQRYIKEQVAAFRPAQMLNGTVLLSVQVQADGKLGEIHFVRRLNKVYDAEALRIIREGPSWLSASDKTAEFLVEVKF